MHGFSGVTTFAGRSGQCADTARLVQWYDAGTAQCCQGTCNRKVESEIWGNVSRQPISGTRSCTFRIQQWQPQFKGANTKT